MGFWLCEWRGANKWRLWRIPLWEKLGRVLKGSHRAVLVYENRNRLTSYYEVVSGTARRTGLVRIGTRVYLLLSELSSTDDSSVGVNGN